MIVGAFVILKLDELNDDIYRGEFYVVDGDTLRHGDKRLRLLGFDALELNQRCGEDGDSWACGQAARQALKALVEKSGFYCKGGKEDRYQRFLVFCYVNDSDVGEVMVSSGMAVATQALLYQKEQRLAQKEGVGLWSGPFERPSDWRKTHRRAEMDAPIGAMLMVVRQVIGW